MVYVTEYGNNSSHLKDVDNECILDPRNVSISPTVWSIEKLVLVVKQTISLHMKNAFGVNMLSYWNY